MSIDFRKFFCRVFGSIGWVYRLLGCIYHEPTPPIEYVEVDVCLPCDNLATDGCDPEKVLRISFVRGDEPTDYCDPSKCCNVPVPPPPPNKYKLIKEKQYKNAGKLVCPVLMPEYGITLTTTDKEAEDFADRFAREGWGNFMRLFVAGNWEPFYQKENVISMPYSKYAPWMSDAGKFDLEKRMLSHFDQLFRRAGYLADRYIMPMFTLLDNCSLHIGAGKRNGFWDTHWMNGDNNVNDTSNEAYSQTHWYEYNGEDDKEERPGMYNTGMYLMELYGYVLEEAKKRFGDFFLIEIGNEIDARNNYHRMLRSLINGELGQRKTAGRVFTSMKHDHFYKSRQVYQHCIPVLHGVQHYEEYQERVKLVPGNNKHGASQDGREPLLTVAETKENVGIMLHSDSVMYEGNLRPLFVKEGDPDKGFPYSTWVNLIRAGRYREIDWTLKSLPWDLLRAYGTAFSLYLGG